jgi:hypothetical protein
LITKSKILSLSSLLILAVDIHFIYSSHLARQEIILVFIFLTAFYYFLKKIIDLKNIDNYNLKSSPKIKENITLGIILGSAIGFHPNSFIIALPFIFIYSYYLLSNKKNIFKSYFIFAISLGFCALLFIYLSFKFDPNFINNYSRYGAELGVLNSFSTKLENFKYFYQKLFYRVSGTYYIPPIKFQFIFFAFTFLASIVKAFLKKDRLNLYLILSLIAINIGYFIIGRYNQTSIIFIFPICYLLFLNLIKNLDIKFYSILIIVLTVSLSLNTAFTLIEDSHYNYDDYLNDIKRLEMLFDALCTQEEIYKGE